MKTANSKSTKNLTESVKELPKEVSKEAVRQSLPVLLPKEEKSGPKENILISTGLIDAYENLMTELCNHKDKLEDLLLVI